MQKQLHWKCTSLVAEKQIVNTKTKTINAYLVYFLFLYSLRTSENQIFHTFSRGLEIKYWSEMKLLAISNNHLSANLTKWSNSLNQFLGKSQRIVLVCLTILWGWCLTLNVSWVVILISQAQPPVNLQSKISFRLDILNH